MLAVASVLVLTAHCAYGADAGSAAVPQPFTAAQLIAEAQTLAGRLLVLRGEVIGPVLPRGINAWVNVGSEGIAIGVWVRAELAAVIHVSGGYRVTGDTIIAEGIVNPSCVEHGGELDFHAESLTVLSVGGPAEARRLVSWPLALTAAGLGLVLFGFALLRGGRRSSP